MKILDPKTQKIHYYKDKFSPANILYVLEKSIDIYSPKFDFSKYQEFRKPILKRLGLSKDTRLVPYSQII